LPREERTVNYKLILILVLAGLSVMFIIQNVNVVEIRFLFWSIQMSRALLMFFLFAIGIIIGWFLQSFFKRSQGTPG
jgi:putative membrane protein